MADINLPNQLILPEPETLKEQDLYKTLQDYAKDVSNSFSGLEEIEAITAGTGLTDTGNTFSVNVDNSTIAISGGNLIVKDLGVATGKLAADAVDGTKIADNSIDSEHYVDGSIDLEHLATAIKSGADATLVTGTKGTTNYTSKWNADGDLVDGYEVLDEDDMASDSATKLATQQSIKAYVDSLEMTNFQIFTSSGTFTAPTGVTKVFITAVGGGGGGGGCSTGANGSGAGGGAGAHIISHPVTVVAGNNYTVTVNSGGTGGSGASNGSNGGSVSFAAASVILTCPGGGGGVSRANGGTAGAGGTGSEVTGIGSIGVKNSFGASGGIRHIIVAGASGGAGLGNTGGGEGGGGGAGSPLGAGGNGGAAGASGAAGTGFGSGGGGGGTGTSSGGNGTNGIVIVQW